MDGFWSDDVQCLEGTFHTFSRKNDSPFDLRDFLFKAIQCIYILVKFIQI